MTFFVEIQAQEKFFQEALQKGPSIEGSFWAENTKNKSVSVEKMKEYAVKNGYFVGRHTHQTINRFGNYFSMFKTFEFIPSQNYPEYAFNMLKGSSWNGKFNQMNKGGIYYLPEKEKVYSGGIVKILSGYKTVFKQEKVSLWSGTLKNGLIHGKGIGFVQYQGGKYTLIEGTFSYGLPTTELVMKNVSKNDKNSGAIDSKDITTNKKEVSRWTTADLMENIDAGDAKLKEAINLRISNEQYKIDVAGIEAAYKQSLVLNEPNYTKYKEFSVYEIVWVFIDSYEKLNYDPDNILPKAKELLDVYNVIAALQLDFSDKYRFVSLNWFHFSWNDNREARDRQCLNEAVRIVKNPSKYGFEKFFSKVSGTLSQKRSDFEVKISKVRAEYNEYIDNWRKEWAEIDARLRKEIDSDRSKLPSGELTGVGWPAHRWCHEKNGEIIFKSGSEFVKYNIFYGNRSGTEIDYYQIIGGSSKIYNKIGNKQYKTFAEMINAISNAIQ